MDRYLASGDVSVWSEALGYNDPPVVIITAPDDGSAYTVGATISFSCTVIDDGVFAPVWSANGTPFATTDPTLLVSTPGDYIIVATVTDGGGLTDFDSITVTVNP